MIQKMFGCVQLNVELIVMLMYFLLFLWSCLIVLIRNPILNNNQKK
jgi:hypothetical protein